MSEETDPPEANEAGVEGEPETAEIETPPAKHPGGRPSKLTPEVIAKVKEGLAVGLSPELASERAGISRRTYARWKAQGEADDEAGVESDEREFWHTVTQARAGFAFEAVKFLWDTRAAPSKDSNADNVKFVLERQYQLDYARTQKVELTGKHGGPIRFDPTAASDDELDRIARGEPPRTGGG